MKTLNSTNALATRAALTFFLFTAWTLSATATTDDLVAGDLRQNGTVHFEIICAPEVADDFQSAVALLHSFFYDEARIRFQDIAKRDPQCAMAWWGVAMTWYHPLWAPPTPKENELGLAAMRNAKAIGGKTDVEIDLIEALGGFFGNTNITDIVCPCPPNVDFSCHGPRTHTQRAWAYFKAMERIHQRFPNHTEITTLYTLSMLGTAPPTDKSYKRQREAGAILESLFETNPNHPGIAHYIIHAYDYPELAERALKASRKYDDIAPWVPHALHMPSHIYTRLGMWEDSIDSNVASTLAARDYAAKRYEGGSTMDDLHAMDYLMFAYLQTARDEQALGVLEYLTQIDTIVPGNEFASAYAVCAMPARYLLERNQWEEASELPMPFPEFSKNYPFAQAHIEFARAIGAARSGQVDKAYAAARELENLREAITDSKFEWWSNQVEIQRLAALGWIADAEGNSKQGISFLNDAIALEESMGTHPVTPGQILPAREQLGEMLFELAKTDEALHEFELSLEAFPHRFRSHLGVARCARILGKTTLAEKHESILREMTQGEQGSSIALDQLFFSNSQSLAVR